MQPKLVTSAFPSPNEECGFFRKIRSLNENERLAFSFPSPNEECGFFRMMGRLDIHTLSAWQPVSIP